MPHNRRRIRMAQDLISIAALLCVALCNHGQSDAERAQEAITKAGGMVIQDPNQAGKPIIGAHLGNCDVDDDWLVNLIKLTDLQVLYLGGTQVTDRGLARVAGFSKL